MRLLTIALLTATAASAAPPNVDLFLEGKDVLPLAPQDVPGFVSSVEPRLGVPTFFWAVPADPLARAPRDQGLTAEEAARRYLLTYASLYRFPAPQLAEAHLVGLHDTGEGAVIASFERKEAGVPVFRERLHVTMNQRLELVALSGYLPAAAPKRSTWRLRAETALATAWSELSGPPLDASSFRELGVDEAGFTRFAAPSGSARAKKVFYALPQRLVPAWHLEVEVPASEGADSLVFSFVLSADDGALLSRKNLTEADAFTYRVWAQANGLWLPDDGPFGTTLSPHPTGTPNGFDPPFTLPSLVTLQNGPISTNDPWLPSGATQTTGNNVEAYADLATPDGFGTGDLRATTTATNTFDRTYDTAAAPNVSQAQQMAGITQLFYDINQLHDWFYDRGFNEAAGNAQTNNFSRGGAGNDSIKAEAQDFNGTDNANMSTPADGARPRMQMYVWVPPGVSSVTASGGGTYTAGSAGGFGPQTFSVSGAGAVVSGDGCAALTSLTGKIALIDRGNCNFSVKVQNAQTAGAAGVLIIDNAAGSSPPSLGGTATGITIPSLSLTQADGATLKTRIGAGTVTLTLSRPPVTRRAGELDNAVVFHEWGHYLSNRLISDASGLSANQARSLGEGWGDILSLLLIVRGTDTQVAGNASWAGVYPTAVYASGGPGVPNAAYYGLRRYPYSTDLTKNPLTFKYLTTGVALPTGIPVNGGGNNAEVHNAGELWAVTFWECWAALLRDTARYTFDSARERMVRYLVASLKLTPAQPTFTEARDAMLAAAYANDPTDFRLFASAYAKRGLGLHAVAADRASTDNVGIVEDFSIGNELNFVGATLDDETFFCDRDGVLDVGERGRLRVTLANVGLGSLNAVTGTLSSPTPGVVIDTPSITFPNVVPFGQTTGTAELHLTGFTAPTVITLNVSFTDPTLTPAGARTQTLTFRTHSDSVAAQSATDDVETALTAWTFVKDTALSTSFDWRRKTLSASQHVWYGIDPSARADISLVSPALTVSASTPLRLVLNHRWDFEADAMTNFDGAVVEVSTNGGTSWTDVGAAAGYTGTITGQNSNNPLLNRQAYTARSANYPAFINTTIDLGTTYAGQSVRVRLRIGSDQASAGLGWDVDSIAVTGITNTPFPKLVADRAQCINRPPIANAGPDFAADERTVVTLSSAASRDPDGRAITARWTQRSGPTVTLTNGVFTAPEVTADTPLGFELVVNDGTFDSTPDAVTVTVKNVNRAPTADAGPDAQVDERATIQLRGAGTDADGDTLTYAWSQVSGPLGSFSNAAIASPVFTAPEIGATPVEVVLQLVTNDGRTQSAPAQVRLTVRPVNLAPTVTKVLPTSAGAGTTVSLGCDAMDADGDALTYTWTQVSGATVTLSNPNAASPNFVAPDQVGAVLGFEVQVSDGRATATARGEVTLDRANHAPTVVVIPVGTVRTADTVVLDASGSVDPDGDVLRFEWVQTGGPTVTLNSANTAVATFSPPSPGAYTFRVMATDPSNLSGTQQLVVSVAALGGSGCGCTSTEGFSLLPLALALLVLRRR